jgi:hypothetical protein
MVLFGIVGELGAGKTLSLTFLTWKNWLFRKQRIFSNYHLFQIPYTYIDSVEKMDAMREGFFCADEFWLWIDSRCARKSVNKVVADILLKSRKRDLTYCFTSQLLELLDKRVRKVMDFTAYPLLNPKESICKVSIFRSGFPNRANYLKTFYFKSGLVFNLYNHREEIELIKTDEENGAVTVFQESPDKQPVFFDTWAEADAFGEKFWNEKYKNVKGLV